MLRKIVNSVSIALAVLLLAGCAGLNLPGASSASAGQGQNQPAGPQDLTNQPIEQKLALGTLKLEGTQNAITEEQAKALLPLWKAVRALERDASASTEEVNGLYQQIQEAMTPEQVQAIKDMTISREDMQAIMEKYGVRFPQGGQRGANGSGTPAAPTQGGNGGTTGGTNRRGTLGNGNFSGGAFPGEGVPGGGGQAGGFPGGGNFENGQRPNFQRTPRANFTPGARQGGRAFGGMNFLFVEPVITLLQQRSGIPAAATATPAP